MSAGVQGARYAGLSVVSYGLLVLLVYMFVDVLGIHPSVSYVIAYLVCYLFSYVVLSRLVFQKRKSVDSAGRFIAQTAVFFLANNIIFNIFVFGLRLNYLVSTVLVVLLLFPIKFLSSKYLVFK